MLEDLLQTLLEEAWTGGWKGRMSILSEARAGALREAWCEHSESEYGLLKFVADRVEKVGGGHPTPAATSQFYDRVDEDGEWCASWGLCWCRFFV